MTPDDDRRIGAAEVHALIKAIEVKIGAVWTNITDTHSDVVKVSKKQDVTNQRISALELQQERQRGWRDAVIFAIGAPGVIASVVGVILLLRN